MLLRELELVASRLAFCALQRSLRLSLRVEVHAGRHQLVVSRYDLRVIRVLRRSRASRTPTMARCLQQLILAHVHRLTGMAHIAILCGDWSTCTELVIEMRIGKRRGHIFIQDYRASSVELRVGRIALENVGVACRSADW